MDVERIKNIVGNKIFSATFIKKNGDKRIMLCRLGVKKHLKGGSKGYDAESMNLLTVFDMKKKAYRTININTLEELNTGGKSYLILK